MVHLSEKGCKIKHNDKQSDIRGRKLDFFQIPALFLFPNASRTNSDVNYFLNRTVLTWRDHGRYINIKLDKIRQNMIRGKVWTMITGKDLKEARQRKRLSQEEVAELSGYSVRQISRLENDNNIVQLQRNMKLLSCLDLIKIEE